jgi:hypothetical protein
MIWLKRIDPAHSSLASRGASNLNAQLPMKLTSRISIEGNMQAITGPTSPTAAGPVLHQYEIRYEIIL